MSERSRRPMGGGHGMRSVEKAKDFKGAMSRLFQYMGKYKFRFGLMFLFAIAGTIFNIVGPKILGKATTELFNGLVRKVNGSGGIDFSKIGQILLFTLALYVASACFSLIQGFVMTGISNDVTYSLRKDISKKINRLPLNYFESRTNGEILSRVTNDVDTLQMSLNQSITQLITSITTLIGVFIMMLSINVPMTLTALLILPVSMLIINGVMKRSQKYFRDQQKYLGEVNGQIEENYGGHNVVKVFNKEQDVLNVFEKDNQKLYESAWKSQFFSGMMMPIMQFIGNLGYVMVALLGGVFVIKGSIEVGDIQSFFQYIRNFTQPIQQIAQVTNLLQSSAAASERVFEFLDEPEEEQGKENAVDITGLSGNVKFRHVEFGYNPDKIIVHDFSADVKNGQKIAIVGPTGAGKTTIVKLLMRFYDVNKGSICVDGHDIPVGMGIKILDRQLLHVFKQIITETLQGSLRYRDHDTVVSIRSRYTHQVKACHTDNFPEQIAKVRSLLSDHGQDVVIDQPLHEQSTLNACHNAQYDTDQHKNEVNGIVFENICHQSFKYFSRILNTFTTLHSSAGSTHSAAHRSWHYDSPPFSSKSPPLVWVWASYTSL